MNFKKRFFLITLFLIIIFQTFIFINNSQKTSFRYFIWNIEEIKIGKLITFSFISGLLVGGLLNSAKVINKSKDFEEEISDSDDGDDLENEEEINYSFDMPPERDIRDTQPTISVNYRVIKNAEENDLDYDSYPPNNARRQDDWNNSETEW